MALISPKSLMGLFLCRKWCVAIQTGFQSVSKLSGTLRKREKKQTCTPYHSGCTSGNGGTRARGDRSVEVRQEHVTCPVPAQGPMLPGLLLARTHGGMGRHPVCLRWCAKSGARGEVHPGPPTSVPLGKIPSAKRWKKNFRGFEKEPKWCFQVLLKKWTKKMTKKQQFSGKEKLSGSGRSQTPLGPKGGRCPPGGQGSDSPPLPL